MKFVKFFGLISCFFLFSGFAVPWQQLAANLLSSDPSGSKVGYLPFQPPSMFTVSLDLPLNAQIPLEKVASFALIRPDGQAENEVILNEGENFSLDKLFQNELAFLGAYQHAEGIEPLFDEGRQFSSYCHLNTATTLRCMIMIETAEDRAFPPQEQGHKLTIASQGVWVKFREPVSITLESGRAINLPAGKQVPLRFKSAEFDLTTLKQLVFAEQVAAAAVVPPAAEGQVPQVEDPSDQSAGSGGLIGLEGANREDLDANAEPVEVTINGKKQLCSGSGNNFTCTPVGAASGDSGTCSLNPQQSAKNGALHILASLLLTLGFLGMRRKA